MYTVEKNLDPHSAEKMTLCRISFSSSSFFSDGKVSMTLTNRTRKRVLVVSVHACMFFFFFFFFFIHHFFLPHHHQQYRHSVCPAIASDWPDFFFFLLKFPPPPQLGLNEILVFDTAVNAGRAEAKKSRKVKKMEEEEVNISTWSRLSVKQPICLDSLNYDCRCCFRKWTGWSSSNFFRQS